MMKHNLVITCTSCRRSFEEEGLETKISRKKILVASHKIMGNVAVDIMMVQAKIILYK